MSTINTSKKYRKALGFSSKNKIKKYFKATDIVKVNWSLIDDYNARLIELFSKINEVIFEEYKMSAENFSDFSSQVMEAYNTLKNLNIIEDFFTNNGRTREAVYYNWMRGYMVALYFKKIIAKIFNVPVDYIEQLGEDNLQTVIDTGEAATFKKDALADLKIESKKIHIEVQAGFTGENDIKQSKAIDANLRKSDGWITYVLHFDLYNGKLAIIDISSLSSLSADHWISNNRFEGVYTVKIPDNAFIWNIYDPLPSLNKLTYTIE